eukprot:Rmarinus@m.20159
MQAGHPENGITNGSILHNSDTGDNSVKSILKKNEVLEIENRRLVTMMTERYKEMMATQAELEKMRGMIPNGNSNHHQENEEDLQEQLQNLKSELAEWQRRAKEAKTELTEWMRRAETAESEATNWKQRTEDSQKRERKLKELVSELRNREHQSRISHSFHHAAPPKKTSPSTAVPQVWGDSDAISDDDGDVSEHDRQSVALYGGSSVHSQA